MDIKLIVFSNLINIFNLIGVLILSLLIFFIYFAVADFVVEFKIYKTAFAVVSSPLFYFIVLLIIGIALCIDVFYRIIEKEVEYPLYLLYKSLIEKDMHSKDKLELYHKTVLFKKQQFKIQSNA